MKQPEDANESSHKACQSAAKEKKEHLQERCVILSAGHDRLHHAEANEPTVEERVEKDEKEVLVVEVANAIVYPGTVMVHLQDANAADSTVVAPVRLVAATPLAVPPKACSFQLRHSTHFPRRLFEIFIVDPNRVLRDLPRVCQRAAHIAHQQQDGYALEDCPLRPTPLKLCGFPELRVEVELEQPEDVAKCEDAVQAQDYPKNEEHGDELPWLC